MRFSAMNASLSCMRLFSQCNGGLFNAFSQKRAIVNCFSGTSLVVSGTRQC